jgi:hypothetical protein
MIPDICKILTQTFDIAMHVMLPYRDKKKRQKNHIEHMSNDWQYGLLLRSVYLRRGLHVSVLHERLNPRVPEHRLHLLLRAGFTCLRRRLRLLLAQLPHRCTEESEAALRNRGGQLQQLYHRVLLLSVFSRTSSP